MGKLGKAWERKKKMILVRRKNYIGLGLAVVLAAFLLCAVLGSKAYAAVEYSLIVNNGETSNTYTISTENGRDNDGFPMIPLGCLRDGTGAGLGWYNTGYGAVLVWGTAENPAVMVVNCSRIYVKNAAGAYESQVWVGAATTKNGVSYIPMKLAPYLGFEKTVDTENKTITLTMANACTPVSADSVYAEANSAVMSYLNPPVVWLGSGLTYYNPAKKDRTINVTLATNAINNVVIKPGQEFSFNKVVGQRTAAKGYKKAIIFSGGGQVMGLGGGVCQVSTTLYQAVKKSGLKITERHSHSQKVSYATSETDATVSYGTKDFRFVNNTDGNIYIKTTAQGGELYMSIYKGNLPSDTAKYLQ